MLSIYITRDGRLAMINGISEYYCFGETHIMISGTVDGDDCEWDKHGNYRLNSVLGIKTTSTLDLVDWVKEDRGNGMYYFEAKGNRR